MTGRAIDRPALRVYIAPGCLGCRTALRRVDAVRRSRPGQPVEVIDLADRPDEPLPAGVVGTPTYLLGDQVISMGNPNLAELLERLDSARSPAEDEA
ncbi:MAG: hypothetical protein ACRDSE_22405 [Pseudonocardiaceae bacterium]